MVQTYVRFADGCDREYQKCRFKYQKAAGFERVISAFVGREDLRDRHDLMELLREHNITADYDADAGMVRILPERLIE